jgi:uncharacterized alkaline shock family protein YloU
MLEKINEWLDRIRATDFHYLAQKEFLIIGGVALGLILLLLLKRLCPTRQIRAFTGETGYVEISRSALLEMVHSACEQLPEVRKPSIKIKAHRKLNISVRIRLDSSAHLRDTASFLQSHLKDALETNLGIENLGKIQILVTGVRASSRPDFDLNPTSGIAEENPVLSLPSASPRQTLSAAKPEPKKEPKNADVTSSGPSTTAVTPEKAPEQTAPPIANITPSSDPKTEKEEEKKKETDPKKVSTHFFEKKKP